MKRFAFNILLLSACLTLWLAGCPTTGDPVMLDASVGSEEFAEIESIETLLLQFLALEDKNALLEAEYKISQLLEKKSYNKEYEASITGLYGEILFYQGNRSGAKSSMDKVAVMAKKEPQLFILRALLEKDPAKSISLLEEGTAVAMEIGKIKLYLARFYFKAGDYGNATSAYDEAFVLLGDTARELFGKNRDMAFQFILNPPEDASALNFIEKEILSVQDVLEILLRQSTYLDTILLDKKEDLEKVLVKLKEKKFFSPDYLRLKDPLVRKDTAFLLLAVSARLENDPSILSAYGEQFRENSMESPVPDVKTGDYYFDAVLVLVEREIMELSDGINFFPNKTVSGMELNEILKRMKNYYGY